MDKKEIEAYKAGFLNGADIKNNFKIMMFGYEVGKLLDIIGEYEMTTTHEKKKMTRKEAIDSLRKHCPVDYPEQIIDFYIEAGMLEIVEDLDTIYIKDWENDIQKIKISEAIIALQTNGFKVTKL